MPTKKRVDHWSPSRQRSLVSPYDCELKLCLRASLASPDLSKVRAMKNQRVTIHSGSNTTEAKLNGSVGDVAVSAEDKEKLDAALTETIALFNQIMPEKVQSVKDAQTSLNRKRGIVLTGKSQAGKSTLLNGLLGCPLLPAGIEDDEEAKSSAAFDPKTLNSTVTHILVEVIRVPHIKGGALIEFEYRTKEKEQLDWWRSQLEAEVRKASAASDEATRASAQDKLNEFRKWEAGTLKSKRFFSAQEARATLREYIRGHNVIASAVLSKITIRGVFPNSILPFNIPIFDAPKVDSNNLQAARDLNELPLAIVVVSCGDIDQNLELNDPTISFKTCVVASKWATNATIHTNRLSTDKARLADYNKTKKKFRAAVEALTEKANFPSDNIVLVDRHSDHLFGLDSLYRDELESVVEMMRSLGTNVWKEIRDGLSNLCNDLTLQENNELSAWRAARATLKTNRESLQWPSMSPHDPELIAQELVDIFKFEFEDYSCQSIRAFWSNRGVHSGHDVPSSFAAHLIGTLYSTQIESLSEHFAMVLETYCKEMGAIVFPNLARIFLSSEFRDFRRDLAERISDQMRFWYDPRLDPFGNPNECLESMNAHIRAAAKAWLCTYQFMFGQRVAKLKERLNEVVNQTTQSSEMKVRALEANQALDMSMLPARQVKLITKLLGCLELVPLDAEARTTPVFKDGLLTISESVISDIEPVCSFLRANQNVKQIRLRFCCLKDPMLEKLLSLPLWTLKSIDVTGNFLTAQSLGRLARSGVQQFGCALNRIPIEWAYESLGDESVTELLKRKYLRPQQNLRTCDSPQIKKFAVLLEADEVKSMGCEKEAKQMAGMLNLANYQIFRDGVVRLATPRTPNDAPNTHNYRKHWEELKDWLSALPPDEPSVLVFFYAGHGAKTVIGETLIDSTHQQRFFLCELFPLIPPRCNSFFLLMCCRTPDELARYVLTDEHGNEYTTEETFAAALGEELKENPEKYAVPKLYMALSPPEGTGCEATADGTISQEFSIVQALLQESYINRVSLYDQFRNGPQSSLNKRPLMLSESGMDQNITF